MGWVKGRMEGRNLREIPGIDKNDSMIGGTTDETYSSLGGSS